MNSSDDQAQSNLVTVHHDTSKFSKKRRLMNSPSHTSSLYPIYNTDEDGGLNIGLLEHAQVQLEQEMLKVDSKITTAKADSDFERFQALVKLRSEIKAQELLVKQLKESHGRVESIKLHYDDIQRKNAVSRHPLDTPEILEHILGFVEKPQLLKYRLVSTFWNKEVVRLLTKMPEPVYDGKQYDYNDFYRKLTCNFRKFFKAQSSTKKTLTNFQSLLKNSKSPEVFLRSVSISADTFTDIPLSQEVLKEYGKHVKHFELEDDVEWADGDFTVLSKCLGPNGYCPNLEVLSVDIPDACSVEPPGFLTPSMIGPLKLTHLSIINVHTSDEYRGVLVLLTAIFSNSPRIEKLEIMTQYSQTHRYIQLLQRFPHITTNLKELNISGNFLANINQLCKIPFSAKLKKLELEKPSDDYNKHLESHYQASKGALAKFLKLLSNSLEYLHFYLPGRNDFINNECDIPLMPKLKTFSFSDGLGPFNYLEVLKNCPSLKELKFEHFYVDDLHEFLETIIERRKISLDETNSFVPQLVHTKLEKITMDASGNKKFKVSNTQTINVLNALFPNFSILKINPNPGICVERHQQWFENCFRSISKMKQLKVLKIDFSDWGCDAMFGKKVYLTRAFHFLKETPKLEKLALLNLGDEFKSNIIVSTLFPLVDASNLRLITLRYLQVKDENFKIRFLEMKKAFSTKNIILKAKDDF